MKAKNRAILRIMQIMYGRYEGILKKVNLPLSGPLKEKTLVPGRQCLDLIDLFNDFMTVMNNMKCLGK